MMSKLSTVSLIAGLLLGLATPVRDAHAAICLIGGCSFSPYGATLTGGSFTFTASNTPNGQSGKWYDPPYAYGFDYSVAGTTFSSVTLPGYAGGAELIIGGTDEGHIAANGTSSLVSGTTEFQLIDIAPTLDEAAAGFASAFPVQLSFAGRIPA